MATLGVWTPLGVVIPTTGGTDSPQQPNVLFEGNAQILSGTVFKCWFSNVQNGLCYAESTNATSWTRYAGGTNGLVLAAAAYPKIFKYNGTYYLYCNASGSFPPTHMDVYTSSDGLTWTLAKSNAIVTGSGGAWDSVGVGQLGVFGPISGVFYGYYFGTKSSSSPFTYPTGLATSTDLVNWTKISVGAPAIAQTSGNFTFAQVGSVYYGWSQILLPGIPGGSGAIPSDITRFWATNPAGPWTALSTPTIYRTNATEGIGSSIGQAADPCLLYDGTNTWMFISADNNGGSDTGEVIEAFLAAGMTPAQVIATYEGVQNYPIPTNLSLQLNTLATDNFQRANQNPITGNWSTMYSSGFGVQISSHAVTASATGQASYSYWNALSWPNDQWGQFTVGVIPTSNVSQGILLRASTSGALTGYLVYVAGSSSTQSFHAGKYVAGTFTALTLTNTSAVTVSIGDVITVGIIGTEIFIYQNGFLIATTSDSTIASGAVGILVNTNGNPLANVAMGAWSGGSFQAAPPLPIIGGSPGSLMMLGCGTN